MHLLRPQEAEPFIKMVKQETLLKMLKTQYQRRYMPLSGEDELEAVKIYLNAVPVKNWDEILEVSNTRLSINDELKLLEDFPQHMRGYKEWIRSEKMDEAQLLRYVELTALKDRLALVIKLWNQRDRSYDTQVNFPAWSKNNYQKLLNALPENDRLAFLNTVDPKFEIKLAITTDINEGDKKLPDNSLQPVHISIDDGERKMFTAAGIKMRNSSTRNT